MRACPVLVIAAVALPSGLPGGNPEPSRPPVQHASLAWPRPASPPIRFVTALSGAEDVRGKTAQTGDPLRLTKPFGITVDAAGRIFVADPGQRGVLVYDRDKGTATRWNGNARIALSGPVGVAIDQGGRLFVADGYRSQVVVFETSGQPVATFGGDVLKRPQGIAVDSQRGRVYVADTRLHQVLVFDATTFKLEKVIGGPPQAGSPGRQVFSSPSHLAVNSKGYLYVSDMWICRIQVFGPDGSFLQRVTTQCRGTTEYDRPHAIAIDRQDRVYVADPNDNSVQIFQPDGKPLEFAAGLKGQTGKTSVRTGIAIDRNDRIYLAEQLAGEGRVQVFARNRGRR